MTSLDGTGAIASPAGSTVTRVHPCVGSAGFFSRDHAATLPPRESGGIHRSAVGKFTA